MMVERQIYLYNSIQGESVFVDDVYMHMYLYVGGPDKKQQKDYEKKINIYSDLQIR